MNENKYNVDMHIEGMVEKQRYTQLEKAQRIIALSGKIEKAKETLKQDLMESVADVLALAMESNSKEVVKLAETISAKIAKLLA